MNYQSEVKVDGFYGPITGNCTKIGLDGKPSEVISSGTTYERGIDGQFVPKRQNDVQNTSGGGETSLGGTVIILIILYVLYSVFIEK